jgi:RNA polymerase sigma factor (TIGR02999 family)
MTNDAVLSKQMSAVREIRHRNFPRRTGEFIDTILSGAAPSVTLHRAAGNSSGVFSAMMTVFAAMSDVTTILERARDGDPKAADELMPLIYDELRKLAACRMAREPAGQTLQATALVHEAWIKLVKPGPRDWNSRGHFFGAAAEAMRRILIDRARLRMRERHGHGLERVCLDAVDVAATADDETLLGLDEALERLAAEAPDKAKLVRLRFFTGLSIDDAAGVLGISPATAKRHWAFARAWLFNELRASEEAAAPEKNASA